MEFQEIIKDCLWWTGVSDTSSSSSFPEDELVVAINDTYRAVDDAIWEATSDWEFDDSNYDTLPIAVTDLVADQDNYQLPSNARKIMNAAVMDSNGTYRQLQIFDQSQLRGEDYEEYYNQVSGLPVKADLIADAIVLRPAPSADAVTLSNGLKLMVSRDIEEFETTDTTKEPGFSKHYHRLLSLMPAYQYLIAHDANPDKLNRISSMIDKIKSRLQAYKSARTQYDQASITPSSLKGGAGDSSAAI